MNWTEDAKRWRAISLGMSTSELLETMQESIKLMKDYIRADEPMSADYYYHKAMFYADRYGRQAGAEIKTSLAALASSI